MSLDRRATQLDSGWQLVAFGWLVLSFGPLLVAIVVLREPGLPGLVRAMCWLLVAISTLSFVGFGLEALRRFRRRSS